jgi:ribosomal protein L37AE/L43A
MTSSRKGSKAGMTSQSTPSLARQGQAMTPKRKRERPPCPKCTTSMIVIRGFHLDQEHKTFECLRCGHVEKTGTASHPATPINPS